MLAVAIAGPLTIEAGLHSAHSARTLFELVAAVVLIIVFFRWLVAGTLLFLLLTFPAELPGSIGAGATLAKPLGLVLASSWLLTYLQDPRRPLLFRDSPLVGGFAIGYVAWALSSLVWSRYLGNTVHDLTRLILGVALLVVVFSVAKARREFLILVAGYLGASALTSIYVLASGVTIANGRATGGLNDPNYLASELVLAVISGSYLLGSTGKRSLRGLIVAAVALDVVAFLLTQSRGGIVGMVAGTAVAIIVAGRSRPTVIAVVAVAAAAIVGWVAFAAPANLRHRVTDFSSQASSGRADSWQIAWAITKAHPLDGIGLGGYRDEQIKYAASSINVQHITYIIDDQLIVHNTYLETLAELGFVGLLALGGTMGVCVVQGGRAIRAAAANGDYALANAIRGLVAGSCGLLTSYIFLSAEYEKPLWFTLALLAASVRVASPTVSEPEGLTDVRSRTEALRVVPAVSAPL